MPALELRMTTHPLLLRIVDELAEQGWSQQNIFLPEALTKELASECRARFAKGQLRPAAIGRGDSQQIREGVRGDYIQWLEPGQSQACDRYLNLLEQLREALNQHLYLGLEDFEGHFALYPAGAFYAAHLDRFRDDDRRSISVVLYLNDNWLADQGGQLRLHLEDRQQDVMPHGGALVVFRSADILHEVLPAQRERLSVVGWFRRRGEAPF